MIKRESEKVVQVFAPKTQALSEGEKFGKMSKLAPYPLAYLEAANLVWRSQFHA